MRFKFSSYPKDQEDAERFRQVEDNFAPIEDLATKAEKVVKISNTAPKSTEMADGDRVEHYDGTNYYTYIKVGGKLLKSPAWTEV